MEASTIFLTSCPVSLESSSVSMCCLEPTGTPGFCSRGLEIVKHTALCYGWLPGTSLRVSSRRWAWQLQLLLCIPASRMLSWRMCQEAQGKGTTSVPRCDPCFQCYCAAHIASISSCVSFTGHSSLPFFLHSVCDLLSPSLLLWMKLSPPLCPSKCILLSQYLTSPGYTSAQLALRARLEVL